MTAKCEHGDADRNQSGRCRICRHHDSKKVRAYPLVAEKALGRPLPPKAVVHHYDENPLNNAPSNLVICPDNSYHMMLHRRARAYAACGHADWRKCTYCGKYDDPANLHISRVTANEVTCCHKSCKREYDRTRYISRRASLLAASRP